MTGSAKQSIASYAVRWIASSLSLLAMTLMVRMTSEAANSVATVD